MSDRPDRNVWQPTQSARQRPRPATTTSRGGHPYQLELEHETLTARRSELAADNRLSASITNFTQRALHGIDTLDFHGRQQLLRLVLENVRVQGWNVELHLRIPLDDTPPANTSTRASRTNKRSRPRSPPTS
ncbi:MAG TPA: hypothetical protein VIT42_19920 [Microlunatus sp.]